MARYAIKLKVSTYNRNTKIRQTHTPVYAVGDSKKKRAIRKAREQAEKEFSDKITDVRTIEILNIRNHGDRNG